MAKMNINKRERISSLERSRDCYCLRALLIDFWLTLNQQLGELIDHCL